MGTGSECFDKLRWPNVIRMCSLLYSLSSLTDGGILDVSGCSSFIEGRC
jgi:hypothetical protein